ncbi:MAG TPA: molybdate ABC transporter substrate-binding protein [Polyangia bacterium]
MNRRRFVRIGLVAACLAAPFQLPRARGGEAQELVVFAASSLHEVFQTIASVFEKRHPDLKVRFNFAGSQDLRVQIEHGAKADVFASADWKHMKSLASQGMVVEPAVFARNVPVVVVPKNNPAKVTTFADLAKVKHLVVGAPEVPIGAYTETIFAAAEKPFGKAFAEKVRANVRSRELNVRQVLTKVAMGEGDAGIVYKTDATTMPDKVLIIEIPTETNVVADYPVAVLKAAPHPDLARDFVKLVLSKEGEKVLAAAGFTTTEAQAKR